MTYSPDTSPSNDRLENEPGDVQTSGRQDQHESPNSLTSGMYAAPEARRRVRRRRRKGGVFRRVLKRLGFRRRGGGIILAVISLIIIGIIVYVALVFDTFSRINSSISNIERIVGTLPQSSTTISLNDFERLQRGVADVDDTLNLSQKRLILLRPFSGMSSTINTTLMSLDIAKTLTSATKDMLNGLQPAVYYLVSGETATGAAQIASGDRLVELLQIAHGQFEKAQQTLDQANTLISQLNVEDTSLDLLRTTERIVSFYKQVSSINGVLLNSSDLLNVVLGLNGDKTYLVMGVNSDELRPSGGFLSTWGWFTVRNGRMVDYDYSASTIDSPHPPDPGLATSLDIPNWWIQFRQPIYAAWDGSWFADFPSTAEMAMWYYNNGNNEHAPVDGVVSIDLYGFEYLLAVLGEVELPDYDVAVTAENFRSLVYDIREHAPGEVPHKQFVAAMYKQIMAQWQDFSRDPEKNTEILNALVRAIQEKHVMVYLADNQLDDVVGLLGWSGQQQETDATDYLMPVNSNLSNKASRSVIRTITYDVDLQDDLSLNKRLTLSYDYSSDVAARDPGFAPENGSQDYLTALEIYAQQDSKLTKYPTDISFPSQSSLNNLWVVSSIFNIPYDDSRRVQFEYTSPNGYTRFGEYGRYRLLVQKQPGTNADEVTVQVTLPPNTDLVESSPDAAAQFSLERNIVEYHLTLNTDQRIDLIFRYKNP